MKNARRIPARSAVGLAFPLLLLGARSDDPKRDEPLLQELGGAGDAQERLMRLFHEVERKLGQIDRKLAAAGAGEMQLAEVEDSGLDKLLQATGQDSQQVVQDIDRILEIAQELGGTCMRPKPSGGESPLDQPRDTGPQERERTPEKPGEKPQGQEPTTPKPEGDDPRDGTQQNPLEGENKPGTPRQDPEGPAVPRSDDSEAWGFLPQRFQETFRNQGREDLPVQYRDWIDAYYRRLNETR
jgi:hypothetical protein